MRLKSCYVKQLWLVVGLFCFLQKGNAQLDSLIQVATSLTNGKEKIDTWILIANIYNETNPDKSVLYCDSIIQLSEEIRYHRGKNSAIGIKGNILHRRGQNIEALSLAKEGLELAVMEKDTSMIILRENLLGMIYSDLELYDLSSTHLLQCALLSEKEGSISKAAIAYYNLGTVFFDMDDNSNARKYVSLAIELLESVDDYSKHCPLIDALASLTEDPEEARQLYLDAKRYCEENDTPYFLTTIYNSLGVNAKNKGNYEEALKNYHFSLQYARRFEVREYEIHALTNLGEAFLEMEQLDSALFYIQKGEALAFESNYQESLQKIYQHLGDIYTEQGNFELANSYNIKAFDVRDSLYSSQVEQQIQINAEQFQLERKERQIAEQELEISRQQNARNRMLIIGILLLTAITSAYQWYLRRQQIQKQKAELAYAQQQAEADRLRELDELKTNFFTNISHELRTPLTLILSPLADLQNSIKAIPIREKLSVIKTNAQRLLGLVNEIMDLAKVEAGKLELQRSKVNLEEFVKRNVFSFESLAQIRRIQLELDYMPGTVTVMVDRDKLEKIIQNLLSNAIKYTKAGGKVSVRVNREADDFIFEVEDTGQGIATENLSRVFERFYQAKQGSLQGGTGVGLALSRELAELMQGALTVKSEIGEGSTFTLSVPLHVVEANQEGELAGVVELADDDVGEAKKSSSAVFAPIAIAGEKPRLLIVEDNPDMGKYLVQVLSEYYQCVLASDGEEALKQLRNSRFDCITSDVMMPNMDGFELRAAINQNQDWKQIPFLLLTARNLEDDKIQGFQLGIDDYVTKPFSTRELQARIHNLIVNKLEREAFAKKEKEAPEEERLSVEQQFLAQAETVVIENISNPQFGVEDLARGVNYSSKQLGRLLKKHTGLTSVNFILEVRLQKARELLERRLCATVLEAQVEVGISSNSYFTKKFTERFGKNPSELL